MKTKLRIISREIPADMATPVGIYLKIRDLYPKSALLESSDYHTSHNSVSYIGVDPVGEFRVSGGKIKTTRPGGVIDQTEITDDINVVESLRGFVESFELEGDTAADVNGLFGFTAYDAVRYFEKVDITPREREFEDIPDICYILYRFVIRINHYRSTMTIFEHLANGEKDSIDELVSVMNNNNVACYPFKITGDATSSITDEQYMSMVERGIAHARRGDVFQIVLSRRFSQDFHGDDFNVYRALRSVNPSPYLFYFDFGDFRVFGSSPETHLRVEGNTAYIDPIAGTFRRTGDDVRDRELAQALLADEKENAEHIMLVDLARNDLS
ncbi:MAG: chorismate-binding protein, partial [Muribaculaceae bacterium]|nr:chorismate-binding protein [Muribaculaceae bacterium]